MLFSHELPFLPDDGQIIYVEDKPCLETRGYIEQNLGTIQEMFRQRGYEFIYPPELEKVQAEILNYMFPYQHTTADRYDMPAITNDIMRQNLVEGGFNTPALLHYRKVSPKAIPANRKTKQDNAHWEWLVKVGLAKEVPPEWYENYYFSYRSLTDTSGQSLEEYFTFYSRHLTKGFLDDAYYLAHPKFEDHGDYTSDYFFETSSEDLMKEVRDRIIELRRRGVHEYQLRELMEAEPTLSRIVTTKDFRIILPDYNDTKIVMTPLPKAVFMLFLLHPEGIPFKLMRNYRDELLYLYKQVTRSLFDRKIKQSIDDVTDPTKNSINEKCARIREAFLVRFDEFYAKHYFITGKPGEPKGISLPPEKIVWEVSLDKFPPAQQR